MTHIIQRIGRSETIEVAILNNAVREFKFSDNESTLQKVVLEGIIIHSAALGMSKNNRTMLADVDLKKSLITLATNRQKLLNKELPLETFIKNDNAITWVKPFMLDVAKSYITIPGIAAIAIPAGPPAGLAIMVTLFYRPFDPLKDRVDEDGCIIE